MKRILYLFGIMIMAATIQAQKADMDKIIRLKQQFEKANHLKGKLIVSRPVLSSEEDTLAWIFSYRGAYIVISTREELPPVKSFSTENDFPFDSLSAGITLRGLISDDLSAFLARAGSNSRTIAENRRMWQNIDYQSFFEDTKLQYGPWLSSKYGQVNCKDENNHTVNVTNYYTPNHYAPGCVAITFTQVLYYFQWPLHGTGSHTYSDNSGSSTGTYTADFGNEYYKWSSMLDEYYKKASTDAQRAALGKLAWHCAVAVDMDFEYNGSTSNVNRIPAAANKYFRYTARYISKNASSFWSQVDSNIFNGYPVQFPVYTSSGAGHAIVCDGYKKNSTQGFYHLNMGWWGSSNGWYDIRGSWNAGGYTIITGATLDMAPVPEMAKPVVDIKNSVLKLQWYNTQKVAPQAYELQVKETSSNWVTIADNLTATTYEYAYPNTDYHSFRVRAKNLNQWQTNGWSNIEGIDIQKAIDQAQSSEIKVQPTVVTSGFTVEYGNLGNSEIALYNASGIRVFYRKMQNEAVSAKVKISMVNLQSGLYILKITSPDKTETTKIIKL